MSRLGDMIKQERLRAGWSHKQLAKKSGVSEKFLVEVEAGTRIIADTQATRILKVLGKTSEFIADFEGKADGVPTPEPVRAAPRDVDSRILPVQSGRIEGVVAEKVFYLAAPDDSMMGYRIRKGDRVLILPATVLVDNAVLLFQSEGLYYLRKVKIQDGGRVLLQWYDYEPHSEVVPAKQLTLVGRARRVEFEI